MAHVVCIWITHAVHGGGSGGVLVVVVVLWCPGVTVQLALKYPTTPQTTGRPTVYPTWGPNAWLLSSVFVCDMLGLPLLGRNARVGPHTHTRALTHALTRSHTHARTHFDHVRYINDKCDVWMTHVLYMNSDFTNEIRKIEISYPILRIAFVESILSLTGRFLSIPLPN